MRSDHNSRRVFRIQGRQAIHGRKSSKKSPSANGDVLDSQIENKPRLTLRSPTENQKCTRRQSNISKMDSLDKRRDSLSLLDGKMGVSEIVQSIEETPETKHLKELLLLHLDWSQQQQELLLTKEKQIAALRSERDSLRCRLERMERRMSLLRQKGPDKASVLNESPRNSPSSEQNETLNRGVKRKSSFEPQNLNKRFSPPTRGDISQEETHETPDKIKTSRTTNRRSKPVLDKAETPRSTSSEKLDISRDQNQSYDTEPDSQNEATDDDGTPGHKARGFFRKKWKSDNLTASEVLRHRRTIKNISFKRSDTGREEKLLRTESVDFYVRIDEEAVKNACVSPFKEQKEQLYVPSWRIHQVPRGYQIEGTEDLDDEIFLKRHQKPELEEKRRKRWDLQRLREQRLYEKLQGRTSDNMSEETQRNFQTFLPDPDEVKYIEVADRVSISAFGYPIPQFKQTEFDLPWFDLEKRERQECKKPRSKKR